MEDAQVVNLIVRRAAAGDSLAWEDLVHRFNRRIYNICYRFSGSGEHADDLTQEVFIKMYKTLSTYDVERGAFMTWVAPLVRFRHGLRERNADRVGADASHVAPAVDCETVPFGERFESVVHCRKEIIAVRLNVETDEIGAEKAVQ